MNSEEYSVKEEITISAIKANIYSLGFLLPILIVLGIPYMALWENLSLNDFQNGISEWNSSSFWLLLLKLGKHVEAAIGLLLVGVLAHELIHGLTWAFFCRNGWKSIRFGIIWTALTPYAHCKEPLKVGPYRLGAVMPAILLGLLPSVLGLLMGNISIFAFGLFFTWSAGGDFIMLWLTRHLHPEQLVQDHPDKIGCLVLT